MRRPCAILLCVLLGFSSLPEASAKALARELRTGRIGSQALAIPRRVLLGAGGRAPASAPRPSADALEAIATLLTSSQESFSGLARPQAALKPAPSWPGLDSAAGPASSKAAPVRSSGSALGPGLGQRLHRAAAALLQGFSPKAQDSLSLSPSPSGSLPGNFGPAIPSQPGSPPPGGDGSGGGAHDGGVPLGQPSYSYQRMLDLTRRMLTRPEVRDFLKDAFKDQLQIPEELRRDLGLPEDFKLKEVSETQFMLLLMYNRGHWKTLERYLREMEKLDKLKADDPRVQKRREKWRETFRSLFADGKLQQKFRKLNDPLRALRMEWPDGRPGYESARVMVNHQTIVDGQIRPPDDLKAELLAFIRSAQKEILFNVFDFDLMEVAEVMLERAEAGVRIKGGIDRKLIMKEIDGRANPAYRPQAEAVFNRLNGHKNITMRAVDSAGLNHQKMVAVDYGDRRHARALFSSGNFTQSCLGPEGDLVGFAPQARPRDSIPNANHMLILDSYLAAQLAAHHMTKTLDYGLRGAAYPLSGTFKIFGKKPEGGGEAPFIILTFSPKGGLGDVNRDLTRRLILETRGELRFMQFAMSSKAVEEAIVERARLETREGRRFDLKAIGDKPFAVRAWSVFLSLTGYILQEGAGLVKRYVEDPGTAGALLRGILGEEAFSELRREIRIPHPDYDTHRIPNGQGQTLEYGAKLHHKVIISGDFAVLGTSFNFSEAANSNQEQYLVTNDPALVGKMKAAFDGFYALSQSSIEEEVLRRNERAQGREDAEEDSFGSQYRHLEEEGRISRGQRDIYYNTGP